MSRPAFIIDGLRSPFGRYAGGLSGVRADDLAAAVIAALIEKTKIPPDRVDEVILGCANQAGEDNRNVARMALLLAGMPVAVPGVTVNRLCGSGMQAIADAARLVALGEADLVIAGGVEQMSRAPQVMAKPTEAFPRGHQTVYDTTLGWRFINPKLDQRYQTLAMGETAEKVAQKYNVSREAVMTASSPEPQSRFTLLPGTDTDQPASRTAIRATLRLSSPAPLALPKITSSICSASSSGVFASRPVRVVAARSSGRTPDRPPL